MVSRRLLVGWFAAIVMAGGVSAQVTNAKVDTGSEACASCYSDIYKTYRKTVMAGASGIATDGLISGEFTHKQSGVHYRVFEQDGRAWMSYERPKEDDFRGQRELLYFIGSGVKGRSYLFSEKGFLFETPINWYAQEQRWNMTPAYTEARESPMNLPAYVDCLNCHTSGIQAPVEGTDNKFSASRFRMTESLASDVMEQAKRT